MRSEAQLSKHIERIYEAAHDHSLWGTLLPDIAHDLRSDIAVIYSPYLATGGADGMAWTFGMDEWAVKAYTEYYGPISTNFHILRTYPVGEIFTDKMAPNYDTYEKSEAYNDFFKPNGVEHLLNLVPLRGSRRQASLSIRRGKCQGPYGDDEIALLRLLTPHIMQSFRLGRHLGRVASDRRTLTEALEFSRDAMFVLDGKGALVFMNRLGHEIIAERDGLSLDAKGAPRASVLSESTDLMAAIQAVTRGVEDGEQNAGGILSISRISMRRPYQILVAPLVGEEKVSGRRCSAVLVVSDPEKKPEISEQSLRRLYGLTATEAKFVSVFVEEASLEATAERLSLTKSSARTYLKRVFNKTEVNSQVALMKLVLSGPVMSVLR
jgi:DNA-binding CsgD family transcriptional regulator